MTQLNIMLATITYYRSNNINNTNHIIWCTGRIGLEDRINIMHSSSSDFVFDFTDESHFFPQLIFPKRGNIKMSIKYFLLESRRSLSTLTVHHTY